MGDVFLDGAPFPFMPQSSEEELAFSYPTSSIKKPLFPRPLLCGAREKVV